MKQENAEVIALKALEWLIAHEELGAIFLGSTGMGAEDLRQSAGDAQTLLGVLDFLVMDDAWLLDFAAWGQLDPEDIMTARAALPGGAATHWT